MTDSTHSSPSGPRRFANAADIHTHPLPGIDDGATSLDDSLRMACLAARYGTAILAATPHRYWRGRENTPALIRTLVGEVQTALAATKCGPRVELVAGQEVPLTLDTAFELRHGDVLTLGDTGVYVLVEPPFDHLPDWTGKALSKIMDAGFCPVLAHPERNAVIQSEPGIAAELVAAGALLQLTGMSIVGENGAKAQATAHWILDRNLAGVVASDSHSPTWRPPTLRAAYHYLHARYGPERAARLCIANPRAVATGQEIQGVRR
ncbi:MAG TPA: CpsB/CapC family capsule biosynthesis tyrosine phosphatase [Chthonomonadaceae bacterium]|nr:CpsB/CapC family capsule biosynthesis tyrosine phosphatase [Chthonomonadaceae bacterium]